MRTKETAKSLGKCMPIEIALLQEIGVAEAKGEVRFLTGST